MEAQKENEDVLDPNLDPKNENVDVLDASLLVVVVEKENDRDLENARNPERDAEADAKASK